jgi:hypothetical protein
MGTAAAISITAAVLVNVCSIQVIWAMWSRRNWLMVHSDSMSYLTSLKGGCNATLQFAVPRLCMLLIAGTHCYCLQPMIQVRARSPALAVVQCALYLVSSDVLIIQALRARTELTRLAIGLCFRSTSAMALSAQLCCSGMQILFNVKSFLSSVLLRLLPHVRACTCISSHCSRACVLTACDNLRAIRVVVMTDAAYRAKYSFALNGRLQAAATAATAALMLCIPAYMQTTQYAQTQAYCMAFVPYELWACVLFGITVPVIVLFRKLHEIKDTLGESSTASTYAYRRPAVT